MPAVWISLPSPVSTSIRTITKWLSGLHFKAVDLPSSLIASIQPLLDTMYGQASSSLCYSAHCKSLNSVYNWCVNLSYSVYDLAVYGLSL